MYITRGSAKGTANCQGIRFETPLPPPIPAEGESSIVFWLLATGSRLPYSFGSSELMIDKKLSSTVRFFEIASASGMSSIFVPRSTTSRPNLP